ncbi:MAG: hypothetical protein AB7P16_30490, partial [Bradyrhizobium sp.]
RPLAEAMNRRAWAGIPEPRDALTRAAATDMDEAAHRSQERWLIARRQRLAEAIRDTIDFPAGFHRHRYFRLLTGSLAITPEEAVSELDRMIRRQRLRIKSGHWSAKNGPHLPSLVEAKTFARWFRRNGAKAWMREAA